MLRTNRPFVLLLAAVFIVLSLPAFAQPVSLRTDIVVEEFRGVQTRSVRIEYDATTDKLYYLRTTGSIYEVDRTSAVQSLVYTTNDHGLNSPQGFLVDAAGTFYVVGNTFSNGQTRGVIKRGILDNGTRVWTTLAESVDYPMNTTFNHLFTGITIDESLEYIYVCSGARTDHGEEQQTGGANAGIREVPLTTIILKIPADGQGLVLQNDSDSLRAAGYLFAEGVRSHFDLEFNAAGELFGVENSGDRDDSEEMNWLREGHHYGFPWRIGLHDTPQQFPGYDPGADAHVNPGAWANVNGFFYDDPAYPAPPAGVTFTDPILSSGPDADKYRDEADDQIKDASNEGVLTGTFTPHRSPLGLSFDKSAGAMSAEFTEDAFVLSYNSASSSLLGPFNDSSEDLLHVELTKIEAEDRYEAQITRLVHSFDNPIDAVLVGNIMYVMEYRESAGASLYTVTFPAGPTSIEAPQALPAAFELSANYPNPFNPATQIRVSLENVASLTLEVFDISGKRIATLHEGRLAAGSHEFEWRGQDQSGNIVPSGIYFYRATVDGVYKARKMVLAR